MNDFPTYIEHPRYQPLTEEVLDIVEKMGAKGNAATFTHDLASALVPGAVHNTTQEIRTKSQSLAPEKFSPDSDGDYRLSVGGFTKSHAKKVDDWIENKVRVTQNTLGVINTLAEEFPLEGRVSPLNHAAKVIKAVLLTQGCRNSVDHIPSPKDLDLPSIREGLDVFEAMEADGDSFPFYEMTAIQLYMLLMEQYLKRRSSLNYTTRGPLRRDSTGSIVHRGLVSGFEDFPRVSKRDLVMPTLVSDLVTQRITVPRKYSQEHLTPWITLIIDHSGSMDDPEKKGRALGVLYHFLNQVAQGQMGLTFGWFETSVTGIQNFLPGEDHLEWFKTVASRHQFSRGGTRVGACIKQMMTYFREEVPQIVPEDFKLDHSAKDIVVVNDGQDCVKDVTPAVLDGAKLRAFVLRESNRDLRQKAIASGGSYAEF